MLKIFFVIREHDVGYFKLGRLGANYFTVSVKRAYRFDTYPDAESYLDKLPKGLYQIEKRYEVK